MTSCIEAPRTATGDCSPIAHSTASVMLDLPEPLGPTITDTPGENVSLVRSGKDLKPFRVIELRCISGRQGVQCRLGGGLLGILLRAAGTACQRLALDHRDDFEGPLVRRSLLGG